MSRTDEQLVADILEASRKLAEIVSKGRSHFDKNWIARSAAERQLEIIGTAAANLSDQIRKLKPDLPVSKAKAMRNFISHEYFNVDMDILWITISSSVPQFVQLVTEGSPAEPILDGK